MPDVSRPLRERLIDFEDVEKDRARGRAQREVAPDGAWPVVLSCGATEILVEQNRDRVPELVPLRFDEAAVAPAEWDLKRLITSAIVGGRHAGYPEKTIRGIAAEAVRQYRDGLDAMLEMDVLGRYYLRLEPQRYAKRVSKGFADTIAKTARTRAGRLAGVRPHHEARTRRPRLYGRLFQDMGSASETEGMSPNVFRHVRRGVRVVIGARHAQSVNASMPVAVLHASANFDTHAPRQISAAVPIRPPAAPRRR